MPELTPAALEYARNLNRKIAAYNTEVEAHAAWLATQPAKPLPLVDPDRDRYGRGAVCDDCGVSVSRCMCNRGVPGFDFTRR